MTFYTAAITLVLVMDPLGNIPVFLSVLKRFPPARQRFLILRETMIAFAILVAFALFGPYIMRGLHLTTPALSVAGGVIFFDSRSFCISDGDVDGGACSAPCGGGVIGNSAGDVVLFSGGVEWKCVNAIVRPSWLSRH